jgi:hypothetical protein
MEKNSDRSVSTGCYVLTQKNVGCIAREKEDDMRRRWNRVDEGSAPSLFLRPGKRTEDERAAGDQRISIASP